MNKNIEIENWTNYSMLLRKQRNVCFDTIRNLDTSFIRNLSQEDQNELFDKMSRGVLPLGSEPEMSMYIYAYGKMHYMKLMRAFENMDKSIFDTDIEIIDYGCGQAMGIIALADYLKSINKTPNIQSITLVEPSKLTLNRAVLHTTILFPNVPIITVNKGIDDLVNDDFNTKIQCSKLHIFSNILDVESFHLEIFANLLDNVFDGYNLYLCVSPYFGENGLRHNRIDEFRHYFQNNIIDHVEDLGKYDWVKGWTCSIRLFHKGEILQDNDAIYKLGYKYYCGDGMSRNYKQAVFWFRKAAEKNHAAAQFYLGFCYKKGLGIFQDYEQAFYWLNKAVGQNYSTAFIQLGNCYYSGEGVKQDNNEATILYTKAIYWYIIEAENGSIEAQIHLGDEYLWSTHLKINVSQSIYWYKKAAEKNNPEAQYKLGRLYYLGDNYNDVEVNDYEQAIYWFKKAANQNYSSAIEQIGHCYLEGKGFEQDYEQAIEWFKKAAEAEYSYTAKLFLAKCYIEGKVVPKDIEKALYWVRKAADYGYRLNPDKIEKIEEGVESVFEAEFELPF